MGFPIAALKSEYQLRQEVSENFSFTTVTIGPASPPIFCELNIGQPTSAGLVSPSLR